MKKLSCLVLSFFLSTQLFALDSLTPPTPEIECIKLTSTLSLASTTTRDQKVLSQVTLLQKFLLIQGYFHSTPTGVFGKVTQSAVMAYQKKEGLPVTGAVGPKTRDNIAKKNCGKIASTTEPVTPRDTSSISLMSATSQGDSTLSTFTWNFHGNTYQMDIPLSKSLYKAYSTSQKVYTYKGKLPDNWVEDYNTMFLTVKSDDYTFDTLASGLLALARKDGMSNDETVNFILSFVQSIPYDFSKDLKKDHTQYPYETLYVKKGVCADKTFLAYQILKRVGYGVAILQYLDVNHQALGIRCPMDDSVHTSGYCYAETTNYLPVGIIPSSFGSNGQSDGTFETNDFEKLFDTKRLGKADVLVKTGGKMYEGIPSLKQNVDRLTSLAKEMEDTKLFIASTTNDLENKKKDFTIVRDDIEAAAKDRDYELYKKLLTQYNTSASAYQSTYDVYKNAITLYNKDVKEYNELLKIFTQDK
jgi:peptidoglycan hydrolase-like protein with peptidoglycan-binding domain